MGRGGGATLAQARACWDSHTASSSVEWCLRPSPYSGTKAATQTLKRNAKALAQRYSGPPSDPALLSPLRVVLATDVSLGFLLRAAAHTGKFTYDSMAEALLGKLGYRLVYVSIIILQVCLGVCRAHTPAGYSFRGLPPAALTQLHLLTCPAHARSQLGGLVGYLNILADVLSSVSGSMIPPGMEPSRFTVMAGISAFFFLPLGVMVKSEKSMGAISTLVNPLLDGTLHESQRGSPPRSPPAPNFDMLSLSLRARGRICAGRRQEPSNRHGGSDADTPLVMSALPLTPLPRSFSTHG